MANLLHQSCAPVVLFVYNRLDHTQKTVEALANNTLARDTDLIIYSDAAKNPSAEMAVHSVRDFIKGIKGFAQVTIIERDKNWGLANSIIDGVSAVVKKYSKVIVLEDDILTSPWFLTFMNDGLNGYADDKRVWQVTGWNFPVEIPGDAPVFFSKMVSCWGWATWQDRWQYFQKEPERLVRDWDKATIRRFNLDDCYDYWSQVLMNLNGRICTWAVFWYATIFEREGLSLTPTQSYVVNIGFDGSGENCGDEVLHNVQLNPSAVDVVAEVRESIPAKKAVYGYLKKQRVTLLNKVKNRLKRMIKSTQQQGDSHVQDSQR